jgi:hypothetical protein
VEVAFGIVDHTGRHLGTIHASAMARSQ